ncbi:MAG: DUF6690 family protein [Pirellulaceae bacterium]
MLLSRPLLLAGGLAAAMGVPYVALHENLGKSAAKQIGWLQGESAAETGDPLASLPSVAPPTTSDLTVPLEEAMRFDVTPEWVTQRWPRVSSIRSADKLAGLRVALVSGTQPTDVAGSLTYYFDEQHRVQRITLGGVAGDDSRLVALACGHFGLRPTQTLERGLYYGGDEQSPTSLLRVSHLPVVRAESQARFQISLDLKRADVAQLKSDAERPQKILPATYRRW